MNSATSLLAFVSAGFGSVIAFAIVWDKQRSLARFCFGTGMLVLAAESVFNGLSFRATDLDEIVYWQRWRLLATSLIPGVWLLFSLCYSRGNLHVFLQRWKFALIALFSTSVIFGVFLNQELINPQNPPNGVIDVRLYGFILSLILLVSLVLVLMNLERTFRAAVGLMRWRIKFMIIGLGVLFVVRVYTSSQTLLFPTINLPIQTVDCGALLVACLLISRSLLREGHFDLDVYPSRSVLQNSLTVLVAGIYLLLIGVLAKVVAFFGGENAFALKAFVVLAALVLLTILLLSDRVRVLTSRFVSRHFQRPLYDYRSVSRQFTEATAACVSPKELCQMAVKSMTDIFQALSVTIWLVDDKKEQLIFAASTFLSAAKAAEIQPSKTRLAEMLKHLQHHNEPIDIDAAFEPWAEVLRECHPEAFRRGGNRVCVPMIASKELLGFTILGDRVGGMEFSWQDFDLLKWIGDQVAARLLNARLSQKLLQARELEAFQTMSAFFVHDLKNTANTLNLMLQNLPIHFDNPEFRTDALRGISKTVANINRLISRLGSIRNELHIKPVESDLNEVIVKAMAGRKEIPGVTLKTDLAPLPKLLLDPDQVFKVATNLIFNACEAVSQSGQVQVRTSQADGWAILSVADDGCGMTPEFINRSLFRAFQTTKTNGLGIGMFQSKMIVEAHSGRIEVESEPGKGSTFRVFLPLKKI